MPFRPRNPYYLRLSENNVLPLYVYLDDRHLDWMSDRILQHVLADLRPNIVTKLKAEVDSHLGHGGPPSAKRITVETHRGDTYQFCYFIRKTEPHSVLIKTRTFAAAPPQIPPPPIPSSSQPQRAKRKGRTHRENAQVPSGNARKKRKTKGKGKAGVDGDDELAISSGDEGDNGNIQVDLQFPRRSGRTKRLVAGGYLHDEILGADAFGTISADVEMTDQVHETAILPDFPPTLDPKDVLFSEDQPNRSAPMSTKNKVDEVSLAVSSTDVADVDVTIDEDIPAGSPSSIAEINLEIEEEEKPKPVLQLKYQGFSIYGHCLCVVVEPWPPIRFTSRAPSVTPTATRAPSIAPADFVPIGEADTRRRGQIPLFLPDDFDRNRSETPATFLDQRVLPPVPLFDNPVLAEDNDDDDYGGGMMEFSQILNAAGDFRAGAANDDEDMDGAVFFGDADETREL